LSAACPCELALAYNDTKGEQFSRLLRKYEVAKKAAGDDAPDQTSEPNQTFKTVVNGANGQTALPRTDPPY
jgi:hypothetical protein